MGRTSRLALAVVALGSAGCSRRFGMPPPATREARGILWLWQLSMWSAIAVGGLTAFLIVYAAVRYRRRGDVLPRQTEYNIPIEVVYTAVPVVIVALLFAATYGVQRRVERRTSPRVTVDVTGFDWSWSFGYANGHTVTGESPAGPAPTLTLPVGEPVRLRVTGRDVVHAFWVPRFLFKIDAIPGRTNEFEVTVTEAGTFAGRCAEFCGAEHAHMTFAVRALPRAEFDAWLAARR